MKRPEGHDRAQRGEPPAPARRPPRAPRSSTPRSGGTESTPRRASAEPPRAPHERASARGTTAVDQSDRAARAAARAASRERRAAERAERRRFTRRGRRRRLIAAGVVLALLGLVGGVALVTLSPLMSLTTIVVAGTARLDASEVESALDDHRGTPLALLDEGGIRDDLAQFALIRSYSTEVVPPHTLVVRVVERQPIGAVARGAVWDLVDAAGVVVESSPERPAGIPSLAVDAADPDALPFRSVAAVLLALPSELRERVDVISATTRDDVSFSMIGAGHRVIWGSGERSEYKSRVLAAAIGATDQGVAWEYDVSAPDSLVVRRL